MLMIIELPHTMTWAGIHKIANITFK